MKLKSPSLGDVKGKATDMAGDAMNKVNAMLDELKFALSFFEKFGFRASKIKMDIGAMPSVRTAITGSLEKIDIESLQKFTTEFQDNRLLCGMLNALVKAKQLRDRVEINHFTGLTLNVKLGVPPSISFDLEEVT